MVKRNRRVYFLAPKYAVRLHHMRLCAGGRQRHWRFSAWMETPPADDGLNVFLSFSHEDRKYRQRRRQVTTIVHFWRPRVLSVQRCDRDNNVPGYNEMIDDGAVQHTSYVHCTISVQWPHIFAAIAGIHYMRFSISKTRLVCCRESGGWTFLTRAAAIVYKRIRKCQQSLAVDKSRWTT